MPRSSTFRAHVKAYAYIEVEDQVKRETEKKSERKANIFGGQKRKTILDAKEDIFALSISWNVIAFCVGCPFFLHQKLFEI